jgi:hypothetical protein
VLRAVGPEVARFTAEWLPRDGLHHCLPHPVLYLGRAVPPAAFPKRPSNHIRTLESTPLDGGAIDIDHRPVEVQPPGEKSLLVDRLKLLVGLAQLAVRFVEFAAVER